MSTLDSRSRSGRGRLLISTSTFPLHRRDGTPRFVWDLAEALARRLEVLVLAPDSPGAIGKEHWGQVEIRRFTYFRPRRLQRLAYGGGMPANLRRSGLAWLQVPTFLCAQACALRRVQRSHDISVVNSHWMIPQGLTAAWVRGRPLRFHHVLHVHAADVYLLRKLPWGQKIARYVMARTDAALADGSHVRAALDDLLGYDSRAVLQPNGVHGDLFHPKNRKPAPSHIDFPNGFILFVGRFVEKKGVIYLLRAFPKVRERHPGLGLVLIGYGPLEGELRAEAGRIGLEEAVRFEGRKPHEEIAGYLQACHAAVVPSIIDRHGETEGMPTVVIEAMAAGCRVVASAVDGIPDVLRHGENGWLCREKDPEDLAEKLIDALGNPAASAIQRAALQTSAEHDWEEVARCYLRTMERLR